MLNKVAQVHEENLEKGLKKYRIPLYMHKTIRAYVNDHKVPGQFLQSVIKNDLREAVMRADDKNLLAMKGWLGLLHYYTPMSCSGSTENYESWIKCP